MLNQGTDFESAAKQFVDYCRNNLDLSSPLYAEPYQSFSVAIIDCIYSLRAKYFAVTVPVINRYAEKFMNGDSYAGGDNLIEFIKHIDECGGCFDFAHNILCNHQQLSGRFKSEICYELAKKLLSIHINTIEDFRNFEYTEILESVIRSVKGIGDAGLSYLFMLAGDPNRCKPDVHIHHCIQDACGYDISNDECQKLLSAAVAQLKSDFPNMTVRLLDGIIWEKYQAQYRHTA
ncbi:MAG: hypothetical protein J1F71_06045 [Clostridiales bacterium]|nr:hypothetical protein [Clostridiales bacterium]